MTQLMVMKWLDLWPAVVRRAVDAQSEDWRKRFVKKDGTVKAHAGRFMHGWVPMSIEDPKTGDLEEIAYVEWKQFCPIEDPQTHIIPADKRSQHPRRWFEDG